MENEQKYKYNAKNKQINIVSLSSIISAVCFNFYFSSVNTKKWVIH